MGLYFFSDPMQETYWYIAIVSSLLFVVKLIAYYKNFKPIINFQSYFHFNDKDENTAGGLITINILILSALVLGWTGLVSSFFLENRLIVLLISVCAAVLVVFFSPGKANKNTNFNS